MSGRQTTPVVVTGLRGRDGSTESVGVPAEHGGIPMNKALECLNVDTYRAGLARKRGGATTLSLTSSAGTFTAGVLSLAKNMTSDSLQNPELWAADGSGQVFRRFAGGWDAITYGALTFTAKPIVMLGFNGKFVLAFNTNADRLLIYEGGLTMRLAGMQTAVAPTVANTGGGTYAATPRYYRQRYTVQSGGVTVRRGEASTAVAFTPSGAGTAARVTKSAATTYAEGETHWELEVSLDNAVWYLLATTVVGTTTYDDSAATTTYSTNTLAPLAGAYTNWPEVSLLSADENRLIGAADHAGTYPNRVWWSPVLGTTSASFFDDERVPDTIEQKNYLDIDAKNGSFITALSRPFQGAFWVFKNDEINKLIATGIDTAAFRRTSLGKGIGCFRQETLIYAQDEVGAPSMYWLSHHGPYRITPGAGIQFLGDDIQDVWETVNFDSCYGRAGKPHGVYHQDKHQIWWWIPTAGSTTCNKKIVFDIRQGRVVANGVVRDGWYVHDGTSATAACSAMYSATPTATASVAEKPYIGLASGTAILKCDTPDTTDNGNAFQAYVEFPARHYGGLDRKCSVKGLSVLATAGSQTLRATVTEEYGVQSRTDDGTFAAAGSETRRLVPFEGVATDSADAVAIRVGDAAATSATWTIDAITVTTEAREQRLP